ncbi:SulP family inorganic anion transporter [Thermodesulfobacteriota bacterium]
MDRLAHLLPILEWLPKYRKGWLRPDLMAGMTLAAFTIPEAIAYAELAGLPPQAGLYASMIPPMLYTLFGTSRHLVIGPTAAISVLMATELGSRSVHSPEQYAALAAFTAILVGLIALGAYGLRLGFLVSFISESVLLGFATGAGLYVASTQLSKLFGIHGVPGDFFERLLYLFQHLGDTNLWAAALGIGGLAAILAGEHRFPRLPWPLIVVIGAIGVMELTGAADQGVRIVGEIPQGLPSIALPSNVLGALPDLMTVAAAVFLLSYLEGMSMVRTYASKHGYRTDSNQELLALGIASLGAGISQAYPIAGSFSRTALNDATGARTQLANGMGGVIIGLVILFMTGMFTSLPEPILASVVIVAVRGLFKIEELRRLFHLRRIEFWLAMGTLGAVLAHGILAGIVIGALLSLLLVIGRASQPRISLLGKIPGQPQFADLQENPENIAVPGLVIVRPDEGIFYANAEALRDKIVLVTRESEVPVQTVVVDMELTGDLDLAGAHMLDDLRKDLWDLGARLRLSRVQPSALDLLGRTRVLDEIGIVNIHSRTLFAVAAYLTEEGVSGPLSCDILPDLVTCVQELVTARAENTEGDDRDRLEMIRKELRNIRGELLQMGCPIGSLTTVNTPARSGKD